MEVWLGRPGGSTSVRPLFPHAMFFYEEESGTWMGIKMVQLTVKDQSCYYGDSSQEVQAASDTASIKITNKPIPLFAD